MTGGAASDLSITFLLEQHLGHRTYADNLRRAVSDADGVAARWVPITYAERPTRVPQLDRFSGSLAGRRQVRAGLDADADVYVFNTQVPAALAGRALRDPYVVITDVTPVQYDEMAAGYGHRADRRGPVSAWKRRRNERVFGGAARCVGWSSWVVSSFVSDYGVDPSRTEVIPPGVDVQRWCPGPERTDRDEVRLLFVGGELRRKGGDLLIDAMRDLPDHVHLTVVTKTEVPATERVTVVSDLQPNDPRLIELFRTSDVFVLPTRAETFGIAAVEASAAGLPVIATDVGGLPDIVSHGETGLLLPTPDRRELRLAIEQLAGDDALRRRFGQAARERAVQRFDADVNAHRLLEVAGAAAS